MDRAEFIITVYCLVCEHSQVINNTYPLRRGGFAPALSDEAVITLELCGAYFKLATDKDLLGYFRTHYAPCLPQLRDRPLCVRQAANLWPVTAALPQRLTHVRGQAADPVQIIDPLPLPVGGYTRSGRERCFKPLADSGHCAAKKLDYEGLKLGLRSARSGRITCCPLRPARPPDLQLLEELVAGFAGLVPADKGVIDAYRQAVLTERHGVGVVTAPRKPMTPPEPPLLEGLRALAQGD